MLSLFLSLSCGLVIGVNYTAPAISWDNALNSVTTDHRSFALEGHTLYNHDNIVGMESNGWYSVGSYSTDPFERHIYSKYDPGAVSKGDLGMAVFQSGQTLGPLVAKIPHPAAKLGGSVWAVWAQGASLTTDLISPVVNGEWAKVGRFLAGEVVSNATGTNAYDNAASISQVLSQGFCVGTGCR